MTQFELNKQKEKKEAMVCRGGCGQGHGEEVVWASCEMTQARLREGAAHWCGG